MLHLRAYKYIGRSAKPIYRYITDILVVYRCERSESVARSARQATHHEPQRLPPGWRGGGAGGATGGRKMMRFGLNSLQNRAGIPHNASLTSN